MKNPVPFGKYLLLDRINVGGMAEVFKAKAFGVEGFERLVAVKRILPSIAEDNEFITMFVDEAKISVQLTHTNIAQIFDLGKVGDAYFIALEYVSGKDLRTLFDRARQRGEQIPVPMACFLTMKVCEGLDYAHNKKDSSGRDLHLVHRDVSPQNVLLSYDGEVKLIDFGIAKAAGKAGKTQAGILKGKFGYMAPEQVHGNAVDRRSDIFSLGIVLYELLTGERLFAGDSDFATLEKVRTAEIMPPSTYNRRVPEELEQIVLKALSRDPSSRYQTAMDLHDDLQSFMYTSGNFFARKDLASYMRRLFAEEISKEAAKDEQDAKVQMPNSAMRTGPTAAFVDLPPARTAIDSKQPPAGPTVQIPPRAKKTLLGMPSASLQPPVPPPRKPAIEPDAPLGAEERTMIVEVPGLGDATSELSIADMGGGIAMAFEDDEELSTQIYDKPEGVADLVAHSQAIDAARAKKSQDDVPTISAPAVEMPATPLAPRLSTPPVLPSKAPLPASPTSVPPPLKASVKPPVVSAPPPQPQRSIPPVMPSAPPVAPRVSAPPRASLAPQAALPAPQAGLSAPAPLAPPPQQPFSAPPARPVSLPAPEVDRPASPPGRSRWITLGLAGAAALLLGVVAVALLSQGKPATLRLATKPMDAIVEVDGVAVAATASPFILTDLSAREPHQITVKRQGYRDWSTVIRLTAGESIDLPTVELQPLDAPAPTPAPVPAPVAAQPTPPAPTPPTAEPRGGFALDSTPTGARVLVDGVLRAQTTPISAMDLTPGMHAIRLEADGYSPWQTTIDVLPGQMKALPRATLEAIAAPEPEPARSSSRTSSRTRSSSSSRTPVATQRPAGETVGFLPPSTPAAPATTGTGTLRINSTPWTEVYVDGERRGNTPQMNISVRSGSHRITLVNSEFNIRDSFSVEVAPGATVPVIKRYE